jgi:cytidylate kinase
MNFITFTEMLGSKGKNISKGVAAELNYTYFGDEELFNAANKSGFLNDFKKLDEKAPTLLEKFLSERPKIYLDRLQSIIFDEAQKGDTVFFGRGSQLLLNAFGCALHVLVTGSEEKRIQVVMERTRVKREVAGKIVARADHDKRGFIRFAFDEDWLNPALYDLIINTDKLSVESAVRIVVDAAKSDEISACGLDSIDLLARLSLQRKVESALLDMDINSSHIFMNVEDVDTIRLTGLIDLEEKKERIEKNIKKIPEVRRVINDIQVIQADSQG